ncbi:cupin domain-containing protein [Streptomyces sp. 3MP-14]|uniref:Cupin domain-containing protein n=1 Tax=Streptomyces mimosae TaxID=2586635 RepID=A0A5N6A2J4_9ACTN|nr:MULTISPECIES: cupin domain-containing protein [Streptomyces]KAB8162189.1 cupin domain-containing protein [Streptomyces mimosae]KAB8173913.1 cupin domain-containing protein [Streptomyces sp. 3MP-14]
MSTAEETRTSDGTPEPGDVEPELSALYRDIDAAELRPLWTITEQLLTPTPRPKAVPWLWRGSVLRPLAERAIRLVPVERGGERRVLSLTNPGLGGRPYAAGTLWGALQCLGPRETAPAHRHTPGAIRFVTEGEGVWTTVDGDACDMHPGDLVLTPGGAWHDHANGGDGHMYWFDGLDLPMIEALDAVFFEQHPELRQPVEGEHNRSEREFAAGGGAFADTMVAGAVRGPLDPEPSRLLVYRWTETARRLAELAAGTEAPLVSLEFTNPRSGASVLPTLSCGMHRLRPGGASLPVRRSGNRVYVVFRGEGHSVIDGRRFDWTAGDMFVVPSWAAEEHHSAEGADLFSLGDDPVLRALGVYREESLPTAQTVTDVFGG